MISERWRWSIVLLGSVLGAAAVAVADDLGLSPTGSVQTLSLAVIAITLLAQSLDTVIKWATGKNATGTGLDLHTFLRDHAREEEHAMARILELNRQEYALLATLSSQLDTVADGLQRLANQAERRMGDIERLQRQLDVLASRP